jgi:precorrin-6Y C5,15-methyltransferase (decarboxylating)
MSNNCEYKVIGLSNNPDFVLSDEVKEIVAASTFFSGGKRHYALVKNHLPEKHTWMDIQGKMDELFGKYASVKEHIVVFASGDPLFYGIVHSIYAFHPSAKVEIFPWFNSLQLLCHKARISYQHLRSVSVHGRSWSGLDEALIERHALIGVLTDAQKNPSAIARRMLEYNFDNYRMVIGECLEGKEEEVSYLSIEEATEKKYHPLNCVLLVKIAEKPKAFGIADGQFEGLEGRPNMITKMPVRLACLSALDLSNRNVLWDIGFCTGSLSIEAKNLFPRMEIFSFEKREECAAIFDSNTRKHAVPGIIRIMGDFFTQGLHLLNAPDAVFIGGHGNRLKDLIELVDLHLLPGGRLVMNAVQEESRTIFETSVYSLAYNLLSPVTLKVDEHHSITLMIAQKRHE